MTSKYDILFPCFQGSVQYIVATTYGEGEAVPTHQILPLLAQRFMAPSSSRPRPGTVSRTRVNSEQAPRLATNKSFTFWHQRSQRRARAKRISTAGDRALQKKKREQFRRDYHDALREAQGKIYDLARGLKDRFGKYGVEHYHNDLIHRAHKSRSTRKVNRWNAYQKLELKRIKGL